MNDTDRKRTIRNIAIYAVIVMIVAWISPLLGGSPSSPGLGFILWGTAPLLVAILMRILNRDWSDAGLKPAFKKNIVWYLISIFTYPLIMMFTLVIGSMLSISTVSDFSIASYLKIALTALPVFLIFAFFEEFGWRGYLVPKLAAIKINGYLAHAIVAILWATWHLPFIRELTWLYTSEDPLTFIPRLYLGAFAFSILYGEIRIITGTFWPAVLLHGISNSFGHPLAAEYVTIATGKEYLGSVGFDGLFMIVFFGILGIVIRQWRIRKNNLLKSSTKHQM